MRRYTRSFMQNKRYSTANSFHVDLNHSQPHSSKSVITGFRRRHPMPKAIHFIPTRTPTPLSFPLPSSRPFPCNFAQGSHLRATNKKKEPSILKSVNPSQNHHQQPKPSYLHPPQDQTLSQKTKPPLSTKSTTTMGCGSSKPAYYDQNAPRPVQGGPPPPPNGYPPNAYPPQQQQQPIQGGKTRKQKGVKAASNLGFLSILAG